MKLKWIGLANILSFTKKGKKVRTHYIAKVQRAKIGPSHTSWLNVTRILIFKYNKAHRTKMGLIQSLKKVIRSNNKLTPN